MRKISLALIGFLWLSACTPKVNLPEGAPPYLKTKELLEQVKSSSLAFETLVLKGKGRYQSPSDRQSFRFEIRMANDSALWIDIADPILGIKVARGLVTSDETAYYNRLNRSFSKGSSADLAQKIGFQFDFEPLLAVLSASFLDGGFEWYQNYEVQTYGLSNAPSSTEQIPPPPGAPLINQSFDSKSFRPVAYRISRPQAGQNLIINLSEYQDFEGQSFPSQIHLEYQERSEMIIDLEITGLSLDQKISFPFRIPDGYEPI